MGKTINLALVAIIFGGGGAYAGYSLGKKKYQDLADLEVKAVKKSLVEYYEKEDKPKSKEKDIPKVPVEERSDGKKYKDYSKRYSSPSNEGRVVGSPASYEKEIEKEEGSSEGPYVITPEEFKESDYETKILYLFADKVLADEDYNIVHDVDGTVGQEAIGYFGMYPDEDCTYARNDKLMIDYEILLEERYFSKVSPRSAPGLEEEDE